MYILLFLSIYISGLLSIEIQQQYYSMPTKNNTKHAHLWVDHHMCTLTEQAVWGQALCYQHYHSFFLQTFLWTTDQGNFAATDHTARMELVNITL